MKRILQFLSTHKNIIIPLLLLFILVVGIFVFNLIIVDYINGFRVSINNKELGLVKSKNDIATRLSFLERQIETEKNIDIVFDDNLLRYEPIEATLDRFTGINRLDENLKKFVTYKCKVWVLKVKGVDAVYLRTKEEIEELIKKLNHNFIPNAHSDEKIENLSVHIVEPYTIEPGLAYFDSIKGVDSAFQYVHLGAKQVETYIVQTGDTFYFISKKYNIPFTDLIAANTQLNPQQLKVGETVMLTVPKPLLNVEVTYRHIYDQIIFPPVITKMDDSMLRTDLIVEAEGENGNKRVYADKVSVNENEKSVTILREEILKEPLVRVLRIGTQRTPDDILVSKAFLPPGIGVISSLFGDERWGGRYHIGIDIAVGENTPVHAYRAGVVLFTGWSEAGYGNLVILEHEDKTQTYYAHNNKIIVRVGQKVAAGEVLSLSGNTGVSTGPHVHFEVHVNDIPVDPLVYLKTH